MYSAKCRPFLSRPQCVKTRVYHLKVTYNHLFYELFFTVCIVSISWLPQAPVPTTFRCTVNVVGWSKKTSKLRVTGLCRGKSPVTGEFPAQRASNAENVSIWWRHHEHWSTDMISLQEDQFHLTCMLSSWASWWGSRLYIWYPRKLPLLTISRLWRYCGPSNYMFIFFVLVYTMSIFWGRQCASVFVINFENTENKQLIDG